MSAASSRSQNKRTRWWSWAVLSLVLLLALIAAWWWLGWVWPSRSFGESASERGARGDAFGAVAALFSGLAFAGVIVAILMQRQELELQREELRDTRLELQGQREALELQLAALRKQGFEATLFQLLSLHHQIVNAISMPVSGRPRSEPATGRPAFVDPLWKSLSTTLGKRAGDTDVSPQAESAALETAWVSVREAYEKFFEQYEAHLGHYFRNLYNIVKLVDRSDQSPAEKRQYTNLIRAQLSGAELGLLLYNCFGPGFEKFRPLVNRYDLLQNIPAQYVAAPGHLVILRRL